MVTIVKNAAEQGLAPGYAKKVTAPVQQNIKASTPVVTPSVVDTTVKGTVPGTLDPNSAAYQKLAKMGLDDTKIQSMYGNLLKTSEITDTAKFNSAVAPQKVESLASVDTKYEQPAPQKTEVAQSSADVKNIPTLDPNKDDSDVRQAQILANLKNFEATTPEIFNNKAEYDKVVGRANKSPLQQQIVDNYFNSVKATKDKVAAVDKAKVELSSMSDSVLGYLKPTAEQLSVINNDPALLARYTAATQNKAILDSVYNSFKQTDYSNVLDGLDNIAGNIANEITVAKDAYNTENGKLNEIKTKIDNVENDIRSKYEGQGVSDAFIQAKINKEKSSLTNEYNIQVGNVNTAAGKIAVLGDEVKAQQAEQTAKQQEFTSKLNALGMIMGIQNTQAQTEIDRKLAEAKLNAQPEVLTKDMGTTKAPKWMQSVDGGLTWTPISGISSGGSTGGGKGGLKGKAATMDSLLSEYQRTLESGTRLGNMFDAGTSSKLASLKGEIIAIYKQQQKLGTLDAGVIKLMDGLLGDSGVFSPSHYSNKSQANAVAELRTRWGAKNVITVNETNKPQQKTTPFLDSIRASAGVPISPKTDTPIPIVTTKEETSSIGKWIKDFFS